MKLGMNRKQGPRRACPGGTHDWPANRQRTTRYFSPRRIPAATRRECGEGERRFFLGALSLAGQSSPHRDKPGWRRFLFRDQLPAILEELNQRLAA